MNSNEQSKYFDLHTHGIGYLNEVRDVRPEGGNPFWSIKLAALRGHVDKVEHTYFECVVVGEEAKDLVRQLKPAVEAGFKVLVGFHLSDLVGETFIFKSGEHTGQPGVSLKARLLRLQWVKVNGQPFPAQRDVVA